ncbi:MAG: hypothetical protein GQ574_27775 [Crocinitomix sp.]|nr:hypothetical protein [Crocinitomix sp.]
MLKFFLFGLLVALSFCSFAKVDFKQLKKIKSVELVAEEGEIQAGEDFSVVLKVQFINGAIIYSDLNSRIGFNDFKVTITGAEKNVPKVPNFYVKIGNEIVIESENKNIKAYENKQLDLTAGYELIDHPYVLVQVQLIEYPEISCELSMPVHFNGKYKFDLSGETGTAGFHGTTPRYIPPYSNCRPAVWVYREPPINGSNGRSGLTGAQGGNGMSGENGNDVDVFVSLVDCQYENKKLIKIEVGSDNGETNIRYLEKDGRVTINANGGDGGGGGNGGNGSDGMAGNNGQIRFHPHSGERISANNGKGGNGGNGGNGGYGGNAGNGGNGGDVTVFIEQDALFFKDHIRINNSGGTAGAPGTYGFGGNAGYRGEGGSGKGVNGRAGKNGLYGYYGAAGEKGKINYIIWN